MVPGFSTNCNYYDFFRYKIVEVVIEAVDMWIAELYTWQ